MDRPGRAARLVPARDHRLSPVTVIENAGDEAIVAFVAERLRAVLAVPGEVAITVPGGSTPFPIFDALASVELEWPRIAVWPGDDRLVPEDHPASNVGKIRARLERVGARIVPLAETSAPSHFALAWLGMGGDGHIASLFPNTDPRADDPLRVRRLTPDPLPPEAPFDRVSLTIPALLDSDELLFVIRGGDKRAVFEAASRGENDLPIARLLGAATQKVTCFC